MNGVQGFEITDEQTAWVYMPALDEVVADADAIPPNLLRPLLRVDGGVIDARLAGLPLTIVAHEVGIDDLVFRIDDDGRYVLEGYGALEIDTESDLREQLEAHIEEEHDGPEGLEDENAELFEEDEPRAYLEPNGESTRVELHIGHAEWIQNTSAGPVSEDPEFVFALMRHPISFGAYYLFVDPAKRRVRQVFQCT